MSRALHQPQYLRLQRLRDQKYELVHVAAKRQHRLHVLIDGYRHIIYRGRE